MTAAGGIRLHRANLLALALPAALLAGALASQYLGHLYPCEMCLWQRWPHLAAVLLAAAGLAFRTRPAAELGSVVLAACAILVSGLIGAFHAGVEYHWWRGVTSCTTLAHPGAGQDLLKAILAAPIVRCDQAQWTLVGVSLAGWNAILSILGSGVILWLSLTPSR